MMRRFKCAENVPGLFMLFTCTFDHVHASPQLDSAFVDPSSSTTASIALPMKPTHYNQIRVAHAVLASTAWLIFFPLGSILIRTLETGWDYGDVRVHATTQMFGCVIFVIAAGLGIWMAKTINMLNHYHPIFGMVLLGCLAIQPLTEILNARLHRRFPRTIYLAHFHIWFGRLLITAGIIQGGLGLVFSASLPMGKADLAPRTVYGVLALVVWVLYVSLAIVWPETRHTFSWWQKRPSRHGGEVERVGTQTMPDMPDPGPDGRQIQLGK